MNSTGETLDDRSVYHRSLHTGGIGQVFLSPSNGARASVIAGKIKQRCEDFVVKEITCFQKRSIDKDCTSYCWSYAGGQETQPRMCISDGNLDQPLIIRRIASITDTQTLPKPDRKEKIECNKDRHTVRREAKADAIPSEEQQSSETDSQEERINKELLHHFMIRSSNSSLPPQESAKEIESRLEQLHYFAVEQIRARVSKTSTETSCSDSHGDDSGNIADCSFFLAPFTNDDLGHSPKHPPLTRGLFHQLLRSCYPFVKSITATESESKKLFASLPVVAGDVPSTQDSAKSQGRWIKIEVDDSFFDLAPMLQQPVESLTDLYLFRNKGVPDTTRSRSSSSHSHQQSDSTQVSLPLRRNLDKETRRTFHHIVASKCRDFQTFTVLNDTSTDRSSVNIVVKWSKDASKKSKKRKMDNDGRTSEEKREGQDHQICPKYVLCMVKKTGIEHLTCISTLARVIKCRQSDIGVAVSFVATELLFFLSITLAGVVFHHLCFLLIVCYIPGHKRYACSYNAIHDVS